MDKLLEDLVEEYGTVDYGGIWLLPTGEYLNLPGYEDHRIVGDIADMLRAGAISVRRGSDGIAYVRCLDDVFYPFRQRQAIDDLLSLMTGFRIAFYDDTGHCTHSVDAFDFYEMSMEKLALTDPIAYNVVKTESYNS